TGEGIWKHDGATIKRVVVFDELPITVTNTQTSLPYTFTNKGVDVRRVSISETGRLAVAGNLKEGNRTIAGVLWAQDTDGDFIVVAVQNFSPDDNNDGVRDLFFNEELVFVGGELVGDDGTIGTLFVPTTDMTMIGGQDRMGDSWWTPRELLMFSTSLRVNDEFKAFVFQAQVGESDLPPTGDTYIWDGGAGTQDWHTVDGERSNWVDAFGARWPEPPGNKDGSERVIIPLSTRVELNAPVTIRSLNLGGSEPATILELNADLEFATLIEINANSEVILKGGSINSESGNIECEGDITKQGTTNQSISVNTLDMDSVNLKVEGGTLSLNNVESRYDRVNGLVTSGKLNLHSETMIVDGDSELDASNVGATIHVGDGSNIVPLQFSGGSSGTKRKLELNGEGRIEIRRPMIISENEELEVNNNAPWEREGVVINLPSGQVIDVTGEWFFTKEMRLQSGGIVGNFWNDGVLIVKAESAGETLRLSCINTGRIQQYSDINYVTWLKNRPLATYQMFGGTLAPEAEEGHDLIFEANAQGKSRLTSNEGTSALFFNTKEDQNFSGFIETMGSADLSIRNLRLLDSDVTVAGSSRLVLQTTSMQGKARVEVDEQADFILIETEFERLLIEGKGTAIISGKLEAQLAGEGEKDKLLGPFFLNTKKYEFSGADLRSKSGITEFNVGLKYIRIESPLSNSVSGISTFNFDGVLVDAQNLLVDQDGELAATRVGANAVLRMGSANKYSIEDFSVEGKLVIQNGKPTFRYNVTGNGLIEAEPSFDFLTLTDPSVIVFDASNGNAIEVAPQFEVKFLSKVLVREGTKVYLYGTDAFDSSNGTLKVGEWLLEKNAALYFDSTGAQIGATIDIIDSAAALTMAEAAASNGFPARSSDLTVKGRLTLKEGCILQFGGARIEGVITQESGSEVKGALQSVRGELGGVINLAGVITGDTQAGGLTRMGASPGIGVFDGDLLFSETSELEVEMAGTELGQFDQLDVTGNVSLGGKLVLVFLDGYEATGGEQFAVLKASQISGNFSDIDQSRLGRNVRFDFEVGETGLMATAMPLSITSYADWRAAFFTQSDAADDLISGPDQDPENDGSTNRMEYAFGLNPNVPEGSPVTFELTETGNPDEYVVSASFDWANDVTDAIWFFEISDDLEEWTEVAANETGREDNGVFSRIIAALTNPIDGTQRTFLRIGVKDSQ
ncbi:MAG: hypothetical protein KJT03_00195, partial [Verrucomicrobiae bacterium]|nr:hypothetical protein [Verrucomicrobiae bacterium]